MPVLSQSFFARPTLTVARELLGQRLVRQLNGQRLSGLIVETEAYIGPADSACHASKGRTARTEVMFGPPGRAYIYLIYGMHHMLNLVTEAAEFPAAVLVRAIEPVEGIELMRQRRSAVNRRPLKPAQVANGPGKLCQALGIDKTLHGRPLAEAAGLWLEAGAPVATEAVAAGPRVGIDYAAPSDQAAPWRFWVRDSRFVSR